MNPLPAARTCTAPLHPPPSSPRLHASVFCTTTLHPGTIAPHSFTPLTGNLHWKYYSAYKPCKKLYCFSQKRVNGSSYAERDAEKVRRLSNSKVYPIMRTYRNDLCVLVLIGDANPSQVLEAMATDGGLTAAEDIACGRAVTTIETILPGHVDERSTIATKLLAPSNLVIERAKISWHKKASSMYSRWALKNAIARAFEVVTMTESLSFKLCIQSPGSFRDMKSLSKEKMDAVAKLESSNKNALRDLSVSVFSYMMVGVSKKFGEYRIESESWFNLRFPWNKMQSISSPKSAFQLLPLSKAEIIRQVDEEVKSSTLKERMSTEPVMGSRAWWPMQSSLLLFLSSKVVASESWICDHVPVHRLVLDLDVVTANVEGGQRDDNIWEIQLTHAQLVDLANLLDLYYEDQYTCQNKRLPNEHNYAVPFYSRSKGSLALSLKVLFSFLGAFMLVGLLILSRRGKIAILSQISKGGVNGLSTSLHKLLGGKNPLTLVQSTVLHAKNPEISPQELEALCLLVTAMVRDTFEWHEDIESSLERGAWMGKDLTGWGRTTLEVNRQSNAISTVEASQFCQYEDVGLQKVQNIGPFEDDRQQDLLVFKVTISKYGKVVEIEPVNESANTCCSSYPLTSWLHKDVTTIPGVHLPGLKLSLPLEDCAVIELIIQHDQSSPAVSARPFHV